MAILSTGIVEFSVSPIETYRKKTAVILKCIDQLPQNFARLHNLVNALDTNHKNFKFSILPVVFIVFYCSSIVRLLF